MTEVLDRDERERLSKRYSELHAAIRRIRRDARRGLGPRWDQHPDYARLVREINQIETVLSAESD